VSVLDAVFNISIIDDSTGNVLASKQVANLQGNTKLLKIIIPNPASTTRIRVTLDQAGSNTNVIRINYVKSTRYTTVSVNVISTVCNTEKYPFGFNGQMKVDEVAGKGNYDNFKYRGYNSRIGRFMNVDPLFKQYPWNSNYAFAENRVIDGIDLEGTEFYSVHIKESPDGSRTKIGVNNYTNIPQKGMANIATANGYGPLGNVGVNYTITKVDDNGNPVSRSGFNVKNNIYGVYAGSNNPKAYWQKPDPKTGEYPDDYSLPPINETDASAKQHDIDCDNAAPGGLHGFEGVMDKRSSTANNAFISRAVKIDEKYRKGEKDNVTGKPVTKEARDAANSAAGGFKAAERLKNMEGVRIPGQ
jgi:RHS repeat-associated protein